MNTVEKILEEINSKDRCVDSILQYTKNIHVSINFLVYFRNEITHIVTTYPQDDHKNNRIFKQNAIMNIMLKKIGNSQIYNDVLFSDWVLDLPSGIFRIQKYVKKKNNYVLMYKNLKHISNYLNTSSSWILELQNLTKVNSVIDNKENFKNKIGLWKQNNVNDSDVLNHLIKLENYIKLIENNIPASMVHGDFCFPNCFIDIKNNYKVIDWEFAQTVGLVTTDYFSNLINLWIYLKKYYLVDSLYQTFFDPKTKEELLINKFLMQFLDLYGINFKEAKIYLVYEFTNLFLREIRPQSIKYLKYYILELSKVLESIE